MRIGWDHENIVIPEVGERLQNIGVKAIALHPRTTKQRYNGKADWNYIKILKQSVSIPVSGNGDVCTIDDMIRMFDETGCDAVMVARAAQGNPWFFRDAKARLAGQLLPHHPSLLDIANMCIRHFDLLLENRGERTGTISCANIFPITLRVFTVRLTFDKDLLHPLVLRKCVSH